MNWNINKFGFYISWYNFANTKEDTYERKYNFAYLDHKEKYFKKIFQCGYLSENFELGLEFVHSWNSTCIVFNTLKNLYWIHFRQSGNYRDKAHWDFKLSKTNNNHVYGG